MHEQVSDDAQEREQHDARRDILIVIGIVLILAIVSMYRDGVFNAKPAKQVNSLTSCLPETR